MVHLALKLRSHILDLDSYKDFHISEDDAISCVPESVFMFIRLLLGGQNLFDCEMDNNSEMEHTPSSSESRQQNITLSLAQDLVYNVNTMKSMDETTGAVVPQNFVHGRFVHFTCDNIDINDSTLDGKEHFSRYTSCMLAERTSR